MRSPSPPGVGAIWVREGLSWLRQGLGLRQDLGRILCVELVQGYCGVFTGCGLRERRSFPSMRPPIISSWLYAQCHDMRSLNQGNAFAKYILVHIHMEVSKNKGTPKGPQKTIILITGTPKKVPLILANSNIYNIHIYIYTYIYVDSPPQVDRLLGIWGSYYKMPKAIFYLLKGGLKP